MFDEEVQHKGVKRKLSEVFNETKDDMGVSDNPPQIVLERAFYNPPVEFPYDPRVLNPPTPPRSKGFLVGLAPYPIPGERQVPPGHHATLARQGGARLAEGRLWAIP